MWRAHLLRLAADESESVYSWWWEAVWLRHHDCAGPMCQQQRWARNAPHFQNEPSHLLKTNHTLAYRQCLLADIDACSLRILAFCCVFDPLWFAIKRNCWSALAWKILYFQGHLSTDPATLAAQRCTWGDFHNMTPSCHSSLWGMLSLGSPSPLSLLKLFDFNASSVQRCYLSPAVSLITVSSLHAQLNLTRFKSNQSSSPES